MKIAETALDTFRSAAYAWSRNTHVEFTMNCHETFYNKRLVLEVNWAALGSVVPETTFAFADALKVAATIVEQINAEHYTIDREADDPEIVNVETEQAAREYLIDQFNLNRPYAIVRWFIAHAID